MRITAIFSTLLLAACAGAPPSPTLYLLRADLPEETTRVEVPARVGLLSVAVAPYLMQPGVVLETEAQQVRPARYHRWAEPLAEGLRRAEISKALGTDVSTDAARRAEWSYAVEVNVDELHGTPSGRALLAASWRISRGGGAEEVAKFRMTRSEPLAREGYSGLVDAETRLARELALAIARSLQDLGVGPAAD
jgi:uncharacterized lipoprotein YmbA